jgi:vacuolar protein sorting-associated protein 54
MSETASSASRPASPERTPEPRSARTFRIGWDGRRAGPGSVVSEAPTDGRDYFISSNPLYMQAGSSAALGVPALPAEWSSSRHGFHGERPRTSQWQGG